MSDGAGAPRFLPALLWAGPLLLAAVPLWSARRAIRRSRTRMNDPMYRARLVEFERHTLAVG